MKRAYLPLVLLALPLACSDDQVDLMPTSTVVADTETGDGDGDPEGDGDGDPEGDGDGDPAGDGDGDDTKPGDGDGDPAGDGDGDPGDGDGDNGELCGNGVVDEGEECDVGNETMFCDGDCTYTVCGDGYHNMLAEECDDGNNLNNDGCVGACVINVCGDGIVWEGVEGCDDGNMDETDECLNTCISATCGDGIVQEDTEDCDDANMDDTDECPASCVAAFCGDGYLLADVEICDDGNMDNSDECPLSCEPAVCGDGFVQAGVDECDDGNNSDFDACSNNCTDSFCGDGIIWDGVEECEDQNGVDTDACTNTCQNAVCGDGIIWQGQETCDDGNSVTTDACPACEPAVCGDGFVRAGVEECDDGNNIDDDFCSNSCLYVNTGLSCKGIHDASPNSPSGVYPIDPDGNGPGEPGLVWCDMDTDGGGWTLVGSTRTTTMNDQASAYYEDLQTINPAAGHEGVWDGMRPLAAGNADIRFTCMTDPDGSDFDVDLSFYNIIWYGEISTGTDAESCFSESNGNNDDQPTPARRNNINNTSLMAGDQWNAGYLEGEDSCTDTSDFTVDFDDRGMDSNQSDGTDWGEDDSTKKCGTSGVADGAWHIWVREL